MGRVGSKAKAQILKELAEAKQRLAEYEVFMAEKQRTAIALRETEDRHRALFEQAPESIILFDVETVTPMVFNDKTCLELGYTHDELKNLSLSDLEA